MLQLLTYPVPSTQLHPAPRQLSPPASRHYDYPPPGCGGCLTRISRTFYVSCKRTLILIFCYEFIIGYIYGSYRLDLSLYNFHDLVYILFKFQERVAEVHQHQHRHQQHRTFCLEAVGSEDLRRFIQSTWSVLLRRYLAQTLADGTSIYVNISNHSAQFYKW